MKSDYPQDTVYQLFSVKKARFPIVPIYFILTYSFSWLLFGFAIFIRQPVTAPAIFLLLTLAISCPSIVSLVMVLWKYDPQKRHDFWQRLVDVRRIRPVWWMISFLSFPILMAIAVGIDWLLGGDLPAVPTLRSLIEQPPGIPVFLLMTFYGGPLSEELGWRGIALPEMERRWGLLPASLVLGLIWAAWHVPGFFIPGTDQYNMGWLTLSFWLFLADILSMALVISLSYDQNHSSLLAPIVVHFSHNLAYTLAAPLSPRTFALFVLLGFLLALSLWLFKKQLVNASIQSIKPDQVRVV